MFGLVRIQDNRGRDTRYFYDVMGNVTRKQEADGSIIHYSYTPDGFLSGVDDREGMRARYAYDPADRLCAILKLGKEEQEPDH